VRAGGRGFYLWTPGAGHTLAFWGGFGLTFGEPVGAQLEQLGNRLFLRSLSAGEALGRAKLYAGVEWRHVFTMDLDWNVAHLAWVRGFQGVLFGAFGTTSRADDFERMFSQGRVFLEAGYGLRVFFDWVGVQTSILCLDAAVPFGFEDGEFGLSRYAWGDPDDPSTRVRRPAIAGVPIGAHLSFTQMF